MSSRCDKYSRGFRLTWLRVNLARASCAFQERARIDFDDAMDAAQQKVLASEAADVIVAELAAMEDSSDGHW